MIIRMTSFRFKKWQEVVCNFISFTSWSHCIESYLLSHDNSPFLPTMKILYLVIVALFITEIKSPPISIKYRRHFLRHRLRCHPQQWAPRQALQFNRLPTWPPQPPASASPCHSLRRRLLSPSSRYRNRNHQLLSPPTLRYPFPLPHLLVAMHLSHLLHNNIPSRLWCRHRSIVNNSSKWLLLFQVLPTRPLWLLLHPQWPMLIIPMATCRYCRMRGFKHHHNHHKWKWCLPCIRSLRIRWVPKSWYLKRCVYNSLSHLGDRFE